MGFEDFESNTICYFYISDFYYYSGVRHWDILIIPTDSHHISLRQYFSTRMGRIPFAIFKVLIDDFLVFQILASLLRIWIKFE